MESRKLISSSLPRECWEVTTFEKGFKRVIREICGFNFIDSGIDYFTQEKKHVLRTIKKFENNGILIKFIYEN